MKQAKDGARWSNLDGASSFRARLLEAPPDDRNIFKAHPFVTPPMSAESWRTISEGLFRALLSPDFIVLASPDAMGVVEERAAALGIEPHVIGWLRGGDRE